MRKDKPPIASPSVDCVCTSSDATPSGTRTTTSSSPASTIDAKRTTPNDPERGSANAAPLSSMVTGNITVPSSAVSPATRVPLRLET